VGSPMRGQFGDKLRSLRLQRGLSQTELAQRLGLAAHAHVANLEAGRKAPSLELALRAADVFGVAVDYLLRDALPVDAPIDYPTPASFSQITPPRLFGAKLRHLRRQRGLTQIELSEQLALRTQAHISLLESGNSEPSIAFALQLADFFGVTTDYLLRDSVPLENSRTGFGQEQ